MSLCIRTKHFSKHMGWYSKNSHYNILMQHSNLMYISIAISWNHLHVSVLFVIKFIITIPQLGLRVSVQMLKLKQRGGDHGHNWDGHVHSLEMEKQIQGSETERTKNVHMLKVQAKEGISDTCNGRHTCGLYCRSNIWCFNAFTLSQRVSRGYMWHTSCM